MRVLAIDTALGACQAAALDGDRVLASLSEPMARGHQERLGPLVAETMERAGLAFCALDRVAVTVGPGSFTGLRVGLAFAKGVGLAWDAPVLGVGTLPALAGAAGPAALKVAVIDAGRGRVHLQAFDGGVSLGGAETLPIAEADARLADLRPACLLGPGAPLLSAPAGCEVGALAAPDPATVARLAAALAPEAAPPRPLYLRAPDALTLAERRARSAKLRTLAPDQAGALAPLHASAFPTPWAAGELEALARGPGVHVVVAEADRELLGFAMVRCVLDEAEILTLAVAPSARRLGIGRALVEAAAGFGARALFLEVAQDNAAARALYAAAGFREAGRRRGYYARGRGAPAADALVLRRDA